MGSIYQGVKMGNGNMVPLLPNGSVDVNALVGGMVSRDRWTYYDTLYLAAGQQLLNEYDMFQRPSGSQDQYPLAAYTVAPTKTHVQTNMPSSCSTGFSNPRDLLLNQIGFYFLSSGCNYASVANGGMARLADVQTFCQFSYFEFKIIDKVYIEGYLELQPSGSGIYGTSTQQAESSWTVGIANPHAVNELNNYAKYLAPLMQWSCNIFIPPQSGPASGGVGVAPTLLTSNQGGNGLVLRVGLTGLTDRAVQ